MNSTPKTHSIGIDVDEPVISECPGLGDLPLAEMHVENVADIVELHLVGHDRLHHSPCHAMVTTIDGVSVHSAPIAVPA